MKKFLKALFGKGNRETAEDGQGTTEQSAETESPSVQKPNFSHIDTLDKAAAMYENGELEKILLFPEELGGLDIPPNVVYVPIGTRQAQSQIIGTITNYAEDGMIDSASFEKEHKGNSVIPSKIIIETTKDGDPKFNVNLDIW